MKLLTFIVSCAFIFKLGTSFSKYGRTCKDIGCGSNEICVMAEDPCSWNSGDQCGTYPTCRKVSNEGPTCTRYVCPPTKICKLDGDTPKCVDDSSAHTPDNPKSHNNFATYNENAVGDDQPVYPALPGQTTPRPAIRRPGSGTSGGGYEGGMRGSGYPGQAQGSGYPRQGYPSNGYQGGYSGQGGYPGQGGYSGQGGYPGQGGYTGQGGYGGQRGYSNQGGYGQGGYAGQGYQGGYAQPGYNPGGYYSNQNNNWNKPKSSSSAPNPLVDSLKTWGLFFLLRCVTAILYGANIPH